MTYATNYINFSTIKKLVNQLQTKKLPIKDDVTSIAQAARITHLLSASRIMFDSYYLPCSVNIITIVHIS